MSEHTKNKTEEPELPKMSMQEKLDYFDKEIRLLHQFCVNSGYSKQQIRQSAEPFIKATDRAAFQKTGRRLLHVAALIAVIAALIYFDPAYRLIIVIGRLTAIKLIPVWDWTQIQNWECLIDNPLYVGVQLTQEDCEICKEMGSVERVKELTAKTYLEDYLKSEVPVIVQDGMKDWPEQKKQLTIQKLHQVYSTNDVFLSNPVCGFHSNTKIEHHEVFLQKAAAGDIETAYVADWENCFKDAAKAFRTVYQRPYFVPQTVEMTETNWVFVSKGSVKHHYDLPLVTPLIMLIVMEGEFEIVLSPKSPCTKVCGEIQTDLQKGEIMMVSMADLMWDKAYRPLGAGENILISVGGSYE